ncbi:MAG: sigma-70 family RNA polymerase sigma factor [Prevotella sp.]|nr:sigma-70 family RNA polymerase sigma factor [Staphylococcus sp.]MCM1349818.1 sigma-70 family RNA polymerase sigma factor [Prevotella sp.]
MEKTIDQILEENIGLVHLVLSRFTVSTYDKDDLIQAGLLGLYTAIKRYDPTKGYALSTYAVPLILGEMRKELKKITPERNLPSLKKYIEEHHEQLFVSTPKQVSDIEDICCQLALQEDKEERIYVLKYKMGYTDSAIAKELGIHQTTVSRRLKKMRMRMEEYISKQSSKEREKI